MLALAALGAGLLAVPASSSPRPFVFAGVIEGSYGPTWTHADRLAMVRWLGAQHLDTYVHAPKNDPYQRAQWRDPYPAPELADFTTEIRAARAAGVDWVPNVSPGLPLIPSAPASVPSTDLCFSCPADVAALEAKLLPFFRAGSRSLMVSFDDVQKHSTHAEDAAAYGTDDAAYGRMNRDLLNTVQRHFQRLSGRTPFHLLTVLADYSGTADTAYLQGVRSGGGLDRGVRVLWTGTQVLSPTIRAAEARSYALLAGVPRVGLWDNYPANDVAGNILDGRTVRLYLGPYEGRARDLPRSVSGVVVNGMNQAWANRFMLGTVARYVADPQHYQAESAWRASLVSLAQGSAARLRALTALAENSRSSALDQAESRPFVARRDAFLSSYAQTFWPAPAAALGASLREDARAAAALPQLAPELAAEAGRFLQQLGAEAGVGRTALALLAAQRPSLTVSAVHGRLLGRAVAPDPAAVLALWQSLEQQQAASVSNPSFVYGDRLTPSLSSPTTTMELFVLRNRMDAFVDAARSLTQQWLPGAPAAASSLVVTVDGHPVAVAGDGSFDVPVPSGPHEVVATDGAGGRTGLHVRA